jgi:molybdopterin synthase catalytic subunit/molybdopterin converting factor small subunit
MSTEITIEYYAAARELAGVADERLPLEDTASLQDLVRRLAARHGRLASHLPRMRFAINDEIVGIDARLSPGDRVAVLPPVAGGSGQETSRHSVRNTPLSVEEALAAVSHPGVGGIALFIGTVRDHADGRAVGRLDYEAHPILADKEIDRLWNAIESEYPGLRLHIQHRVGTLQVGDLAVVIAAGAAHRADAFAACRAAIERIKETVPIWKKEWDPDGAASWINLEG